MHACKKGTTKCLADTLSQAYLPYDGSQDITSEIESLTNDTYCTADPFEKPSTLLKIKVHKKKGESLQELIGVIQADWPESKGLIQCYISLAFAMS